MIHYFADIRFPASVQDICNKCTTFNLALLEDAGGVKTNELLEAKSIHCRNARTQRVAMNVAIQLWGHQAFWKKDYFGVDVNTTITTVDDEDIINKDDVNVKVKVNDIDIYAIKTLDTNGTNHANTDDIVNNLAAIRCGGENDSNLRCNNKCSIIIQAEDYGGNLPMPWFSLQRPSKDYFTSNLNLYSFIICNITNANNYLYVYDERTAGKDCNALCSLRFNYQLQQLQQKQQAHANIMVDSDNNFITDDNNNQIADMLYLVSDNCTAQNKSQAVLKFYMFLSMTFYKKVYILFLEAGHSHFYPDICWANGKKGITRKNLYHPNDIVKHMNEISGIKAKYIDSTSSENNIFYEGWEEILNKNMINIPYIEGKC